MCSDLLAYNNDFGREFEVCCNSVLSINKKQGLYAELNGKTTPDIPMRKEKEPNWWAILTATSPDMNPAQPAAPEQAPNEGAQEQAF